jgi:hypothetical protein
MGPARTRAAWWSCRTPNSQALSETAHLLRSPANARRLLTSFARANAGKLKSRQRK